ncbi:MAG: amidohydrolase [Bradymonadales bacterium]|nr:amidohydrolase [Bradymonadales bacterium]
MFKPELLIDLRRDFHRNPELSGQEAETASRIVAWLQPAGLRLRTAVAGYGVIADLEGDLPGPLLAYRADMDALPIDEVNETPYRSCRPGVMHACGHDVHLAVAIGIARTLAERRAELQGRVRFLFQPSEEAPPRSDGPIGAEAMVAQGALDGVDAIFAIHCHTDLSVGRFGLGQGGAFAANDILTVRLFGRSAHGAYPYQGVDTIRMAAPVIEALLSLPSRVVDPRNPCVLTLGTIRAGTAHNVIAGEAELCGSLRTFDPELRQAVRSAIRQVVSEIPPAFGGRGEVQIQQSTQAVINHPQLEAKARAFLEQAVGPQGVAVIPPMLGSEDFYQFSQAVPGCYLFLGVSNPAKGIVHPIHSAQFDVDETCIPYAVQHLAGLLEHLCATWSALDRC